MDKRNTCKNCVNYNHVEQPGREWLYTTGWCELITIGKPMRTRVNKDNGCERFKEGPNNMTDNKSTKTEEAAGADEAFINNVMHDDGEETMTEQEFEAYTASLAGAVSEIDRLLAGLKDIIKDTRVRAGNQIEDEILSAFNRGVLMALLSVQNGVQERRDALLNESPEGETE